MQDNADNSFENSSTYKQMKKQIKDLELKLKVSDESKEHNRKMFESELKKNDEIIKEFQQLKNENEKLKDEKSKVSRSKVVRENEELKKEIERREELMQNLYLKQAKADEEVKK